MKIVTAMLRSSIFAKNVEDQCYSHLKLYCILRIFCVPAAEGKNLKYKKIKQIKSIRSAINNYDGKGVTLQGDCGYAKGWHLTLSQIFDGKTKAGIDFNSKKEEDFFKKSILNTWPYKLMYLLDDKAVLLQHIFHIWATQ